METELLTTGAAICNGAFILRVSKDRMNAVLIPKDEGANVDDVPCIRREMESHGVIHGLLPEPLPIKGGYLVAKGTQPENGKDATVKFHVEPSTAHTPKVKDEAKDEVDLRELGSIVNVHADDLLLEKNPPTSGMPGRDVGGDDIPAHPGKDIKIRLGEGVRFDDSEEKVYATLDGKFVMLDGKPCVFSEHAVRGDVDFSVGNITFSGTLLEIQGAVLPGFKIRCKGDILITGEVCNADVRAGGKITIKGGAVGQETVVKAKGNVTVALAENGARLETQETLYVAENLIQCNVHAGRDVKVLSGKGVIIGGAIVAGGSVYAKEIGSDTETATDIHVGVSPDTVERKRKLAEEQQVWSEKMNEMLKNINFLKDLKKKSGGKLPPDKEAMLTKLGGMLPKVMDQVHQVGQQEEELKQEMEKAINERVYISSTLYPGTRVHIGHAIRMFTTQENQVMIFLNKGTNKIQARSMTQDDMDARDF